MRAAIVSMQTLTEVCDDPFAARDNEARLEEARHALAVASALADSPYAPWLICGDNSPLALTPIPIPRLCIKSTGFRAWFKLWQWQRQQDNMLIITVGQESLRHGLRLLGMGKKNSRNLVSAFFILPPDKISAKYLQKAQLCFGGSEFIVNRLEEILSQAKVCPKFIHSPPGLDLSQYITVPRSYDEGKHFVFGMAGSLMPQSGALLVVRAMAALWQNEDIPSWEVRMFGGGSRYDEIMDEAASLGVLSRLSVFADQPLGEVSRYCHVWLAPGIAPDELPPTLWAGFASGLPVICAKSWLHKERVWNRAAIMPIGPENPQEMARAMLGMMRDTALRKRTAKASWLLRPQISLEGMGARVREQLLKEINLPEKDRESASL